jgi:hypothetical protein
VAEYRIGLPLKCGIVEKIYVKPNGESDWKNYKIYTNVTWGREWETSV